MRHALLTLLGMAALCRGSAVSGAQQIRADTLATCRVDRVVDGDTFFCASGEKVRLIGIDTPELDQGSIGRRAREALISLIPIGSEVGLEIDVQRTDRYQRVLAYIWTGSVMVNEAMVSQGWAILYTVPPNVRYVERFQIAQDSAKAAGAGFWKDDDFACPPERHRKREC